MYNIRKSARVLVAAAATILASSAAHASVAQIYMWNDENVTDQSILEIVNNTGFDFTNLTLTGTGYQGARNGLISTVSLTNVAANTSSNFTGASLPFNVSGNADYDDFSTGNFSLHLTGLWNGQAIVADFSPHNNLTGGFVSFESMDTNGNDGDFLGSTSSTTAMANIDLQVTPVPEPSGALAGLALLGVIGANRLRRRQADIVPQTA